MRKPIGRGPMHGKPRLRTTGDHASSKLNQEICKHEQIVKKILTINGQKCVVPVKVYPAPHEVKYEKV